MGSKGEPEHIWHHPEGADSRNQLLQGVDAGFVGMCLCDGADDVCYVNPVFAKNFFASLPDRPSNFVEALAHAIRSGGGIKLETMDVDEFILRVEDSEALPKKRIGSPSI